MVEVSLENFVGEMQWNTIGCGDW